MSEKPVPYRCPLCLSEASYVGRLVWLEQEQGKPVLCRYHKDKDGKVIPVLMEPVTVAARYLGAA